ncbi:MAG: hypothetical protein K0S48_2527 [Ramlibacter sp.]|nr:hypothetical protein [Ramlibacter sp.]MCE3270652.1 hypothetical protein [Ramlibacter sp.]
MRICVLGNSHVASLKLGLEKMPDARKNVSMDFFASRASALGALRLENNRLVPTNDNLARSIAHTSGGKSEVVLADYDAFLVYGLGFRLPVMQAQLSSAVQRQICRDTLVQALNFRMCSMVRQATDKPVYVGHDPQEAEGRKSPELSRSLPYEAVYDMMRSELFRDDVRLVAQPRQTFANSWFTKPEFSAGSTRLDIGDAKSNELHSEADNKHMNGDFGRIWLESFFPAVGVKTAA